MRQEALAFSQRPSSPFSDSCNPKSRAPLCCLNKKPHRPSSHLLARSPRFFRRSSDSPLQKKTFPSPLRATPYPYLDFFLRTAFSLLSDSQNSIPASTQILETNSIKNQVWWIEVRKSWKKIAGRTSQDPSCLLPSKRRSKDQNLAGS